MILNRGSEVVLVIPDLQAPFHHVDSLEFLKCVKKTYKPTRVVNIGDFFDFHATSDHTANPDGFSPGHELQRALEFAKDIYKLFPKVDVCEANHDLRIRRAAVKAGIPSACMKEWNDLFQAPAGWVWAPRVKIEGVVYEHGMGVGGRYAHANAAINNMASTVIGHHHANAGIHFISGADQLIFGMAVGCLIDQEAYAFSYARYANRKSVLGCGVVDKGVPVFVPMVINSEGRWVGHL